MCQLRNNKSFIVAPVLVMVLAGLPAEHIFSRGAASEFLPTYLLFIYWNKKTALKELDYCLRDMT